MILKQIRICNFKNIGEAKLEFSPKVNGLLGHNGMGKSNLLDAIYYLSFCKSFSGMTDSMLMRRGEDFLMVQGSYLRRGLDEEVAIGINKGRRKSLKRQGKEYQRLSSHIGAFPLVMSSPEDIELIRGASEGRRRLMDMVISQSDHIYLDELIRYSRALEQRNKLLRDGVVDHNLYLAVEMAMERSAGYIFLNPVDNDGGASRQRTPSRRTAPAHLRRSAPRRHRDAHRRDADAPRRFTRPMQDILHSPAPGPIRFSPLDTRRHQTASVA